MSTTEHLALEKFEAVDVSLCDTITPLGRESRVNGGVISTNPIDKAAQFSHMAGFCPLEPGVQCLCPALFEPCDKFLAQEIDRATVRTGLTDALNLLLLLCR